jgi:predicted nucleic acid-binding protein
MSPTARDSVFVDSSVLIAAAISATGRARSLLLDGLRGQIALFVSDFVLAECERNLSKKAPRALPGFSVFRELLAPSIVNPAKEIVDECMRVVDAKDAPIVAGARMCQAEWLVSYDRQHLVNQSERIWERFRIRVGTPEDYFNRSRPT